MKFTVTETVTADIEADTLEEAQVFLKNRLEVAAETVGATWGTPDSMPLFAIVNRRPPSLGIVDDRTPAQREADGDA